MGHAVDDAAVSGLERDQHDGAEWVRTSLVATATTCAAATAVLTATASLHTVGMNCASTDAWVADGVLPRVVAAGTTCSTWRTTRCT